MALTTLKPYPTYTSSGIEWAGDVPAHWDTAPLKRLATIISGTGLSPQNISPSNDISNQIPVIGSNGVIGYTRDYNVKSPILAIGRVGACGKVHLIEPPAWVTDNALILTLSADTVSIIFLAYTLTSRNLDELAVRNAQPLITGAKVKSEKVPLPPPEEQTAIVRYLDAADSRIQSYISAKERLIGLLTEQKQALINQAVTRGLDLNVPLKPSGEDWLDKIPEHWEIKRLKALLAQPMQNGLFKKKEQFGAGVPLINVADVYREDFRVEPGSLELVQATPDEIRRFLVHEGDIFFVRSSLKLEGTARSAIAVNCHPNTVFECHLVRATTQSSDVNARFLVLQLNSATLRDYLISRANTVTMTTIAQHTLVSCPILIPPRTEQDRIVEYIDKATADIDSSIACAYRQIELMQEYRTRLIADVVTGKLDVRGAVADEIEIPTP